MGDLRCISPDTVAQIECDLLDDLEVSSCVFLLYKDAETAIREIFSGIPDMRRNCREVGSYSEGPLAKWARSCAIKQDHWQEQFLEALMIIKNYLIVRKFAPHHSDVAAFVDYVRKVLLLMAEDLTIMEWTQLFNILKTEEEIPIPDEFSNQPECCLLYLIAEEKIKIQTKETKMDFGLLHTCMSRLGRNEWVEKLIVLENIVNKEMEENETNSVPRFYLDSDCPGTIVIFNLKNYERGLKAKDRAGSDIDKGRLDQVFKLLGFTVIIYNDPSSEDIRRKLAEKLKLFCTQAQESKTVRCFAVAILAHGDIDGVLGTDGDKVEWEVIRKELQSPETKGFPRLLITHACRNAADNDVQEKKTLTMEGGCNLKDLWELSASEDGYGAYRSLTNGSFFIRSLCKHIILAGHKYDLDKLVKLVNTELEEPGIKDEYGTNVLVSPLRTTSSKCLYLSPSKIKDGEKLVMKWEYPEARL